MKTPVHVEVCRGGGGARAARGRLCAGSAPGCAGEHLAADHLRHTARRRDPHRGERRLVGLEPDLVRVPVAAVQQERERLQQHQREQPDLHPAEGRRRPPHARVGDRVQLRRFGQCRVGADGGDRRRAEAREHVAAGGQRHRQGGQHAHCDGRSVDEQPDVVRLSVAPLRHGRAQLQRCRPAQEHVRALGLRRRRDDPHSGDCAEPVRRRAGAVRPDRRGCRRRAPAGQHGTARDRRRRPQRPAARRERRLVGEQPESLRLPVAALRRAPATTAAASARIRPRSGCPPPRSAAGSG